jgi:hypothetical protein
MAESTSALAHSKYYNLRKFRNIETMMNYENNRSTSKTLGASLAGILSAILLVSALVIPAYAEHTKELVVRAYTTSGNALSMYTVIKSGDTIVKAGYTPLTYTGTTGNVYSIEVQNYKDLTFSKWGNDSTSNPRSVTLSVDTTAVAYYNIGTTSTSISSSSSTGNSCSTIEPLAVAANGNDGNIPENTTDNNLSTRWSSNGVGSWISYDFGHDKTICDVKIAWYKGNERQNNFVISVSSDGKSYKDVYSGKSSGTTLNEEVYNFADVIARYVKVTVNGNTNNSWASITETKISGAGGGSSADTGSSAEPSVSLSFVNLTEGQTLTGSLTFTVKASDHTKVNNIKAYVDGTTLLKEEKYDPYDFPLKTSSFSTGKHTLDAVATLKDGSTVTKSISVVFGESTSTTTSTSSSSTTDKFGVSMIHPTKSNGEQWFINMSDPASDSRFDPKSTITQNSDGSWNIKSTKVRMNVFTSSGYDSGKITTYNQQELAKKGYMQDPRDWRNVEMTGFVKVNSASTNDNFAWYARGGKHNDSNGGCEGTSYKGGLFYDGKARFAKEQQHPNGYSFTKSLSVTDSLYGKWIGFKTVMYNNAQGNVVLQMWLNENSDKVTWKKVYEHVDSGGWGSDGDMCGGSPDQKVTWGGPISTFRWDSATNVDFKWMSVREIQPPA